MTSDVDGILPRLGDGESVLVAIASVERVLRRSRGEVEDVPQSGDNSVSAFSPLERALFGLVAAHANLSAVLLQVIDYEAGAMTTDYLLEVLRRDARAHADLDALDHGIPFDA